MINKLAKQKLNLNQVAQLTGMHRQTVAKRLASLKPADGSNARLKLYYLSDILRLSFNESLAGLDADSLPPMDRRAFWQAENERLKYEERTGELVQASDVAFEMGAMAKGIIQSLETLPDILERDCALPPQALTRVQAVIDDLRDQMAQYLMEN